MATQSVRFFAGTAIGTGPLLSSVTLTARSLGNHTLPRRAGVVVPCKPAFNDSVRQQEVVDELCTRRKLVQNRETDAVRAAKRRRIAELGGDCKECPMSVEDCSPGEGAAFTKGVGTSWASPFSSRVTNEQFDKAWSEALFGNGLTISLIDDKLFRKAVLVTSQSESKGLITDQEETW